MQTADGIGFCDFLWNVLKERNYHFCVFIFCRYTMSCADPYAPLIREIKKWEANKLRRKSTMMSELRIMPIIPWNDIQKVEEQKETWQEIKVTRKWKDCIGTYVNGTLPRHMFLLSCHQALYIS
jgi:hypothetical protein